MTFYWAPGTKGLISKMTAILFLLFTKAVESNFRILFFNERFNCKLQTTLYKLALKAGLLEKDLGSIGF